MNDTMNDFIDKGAAYMARDRPDLWTFSTAHATLSRWCKALMTKAYGEGYTTIGTGGFIVSRTDDDGYVEWNLVRSIVDLNIDPCGDGSEDVYVFDWTTSSDLR